jgi:hypothetical protein
MDIKTIKMEFGDNCECENDVIQQCIIKTMEIQDALRTLGVDITKSKNLNYIYTYFLLKFKDTSKEKQDIEREKLRLED